MLRYFQDHVYVPALDLRVVRRDDENVEGIEENFPVADDDEGLQEKTVPAHECRMNNGKDAAVTGHEVEDQETQLLEEANNLPGVRHEMEGQSINGVEEANKTSVIRNGQAEQRTQFNKRENAATGSIYKVAELLAQPVEVFNNRGAATHGLSEQRTQSLQRASSGTGAIQIVYKKHTQPMEEANNRDSARRGLVNDVSQPIHGESSKAGTRHGFVKQRPELVEEANSRAGVILQGAEQRTLPLGGTNIIASVRHDLTDQQEGHILVANSGDGTRHCRVEQDQNVGAQNVVGTNHRIIHQQSQPAKVPNNRTGAQEERLQQQEKLGQKANDSAGDSPRVLEQKWQPMKATIIADFNTKQVLLVAGGQPTQSMEGANNRTGTRQGALEQRGKPMGDANNRPGVTQVATDQQAQPTERVNNRSAARYGLANFQPLPSDKTRIKHYYVDPGQTHGYFLVEPGTTYIVVHRKSQPMEGANNSTGARGEVLENREQYVRKTDDTPDDSSTVEHETPAKVGKCCGRHAVLPLILAEIGQQVEEANNITGTRQVVLEQRIQSTEEAKNRVVAQQAQPLEAVNNIAIARYSQVGYQARPTDAVNNGNGNRRGEVEQQPPNLQVSTSAAGGRQKLVGQAAQPMVGDYRVIAARQEVVEHQPQPIQGANTASGSRSRVLEQQVVPVEERNNRAGTGGRDGDSHLAQAVGRAISSSSARVGIVEQGAQPVQGSNTEAVRRRSMGEHLAQHVPVEERNNRAGSGSRDGDSHLPQAVGRAISSSFARVGIVEQGAQPVQGSNTEAVRRQSMGEHLAQPVPVEERNNRAGSGSRDGDSHLPQALGRAISSSFARVGIVEQGAQPVQGSNTEALRRQSMGEHLAQPVPVEERNNRAGSGSRDGDGHLAQAVGRAISSSFARVGIVEQGAQPVQGSNTEALRRQSMGEHLAQPVPVEERNNRAGSGSRDGDSHLAQAVGRAISSSFARVGIVEQGAQPVQGSNTEALRRPSMGEHLAQPVPVEGRNNRAGSGSRDGDSHLPQAVGRAISSSFARVGIVEQGAQPVQGSNTEAVRRQSMGEHLAQPVPVEERNNRAGSGSRDGDSHLPQAVGRAISSSFARVGIVEQGAQPVQGSNTEAVRRQSMGQHLAQPVPVEERNNRAGSGSRDGESNPLSARHRNAERAQAVGRAISSSSARVGIVEQEAQPVQGCCCQAVAGRSIGQHRAQPVPVEERNNRALPCSSSRDGESNLLCDRHRNPERAQAVGRAISSSSVRVGIVEQGPQPVQGSSSDAGNNRRSTGEHRAQPVRIARQRVVLQRAQSMSAANRRAGTSRGRPMDGARWQLPDSTVDENNRRIVQEPPRGMHWLRTYTDNEAEGVVIDGSNPSQRNRSHANEAERDTSSPEVVVLAELPPTRISRAVGDSASRSSSSRDELSPDVILVAEIPTGRNVRAICPNQQQQQSEAQPSGSAQQGSSAQASFSPRPGCSYWGEGSAQPGCPVSSRAHPQPCHSSFSCGSRRPSAQAGGSRWPSDSAETSGSAESGGSSRASGSSESDGLNRTSSSTESDISSQTNGSAESEGSSQASGSVESDGSSRTSGSARSDSSRRASGSAGLVASSRPSGSAESNGSRRASGLSWSRVSSSPSGSASSSGSTRSSRTAQAGNSRDADSFSEDTTSDDSYDETDLSSRVPSTDTRKGQIAFLRRRDIYKGIDFYVTQVYEYKELMDLSRIFELSSVDEDTDIDMYMPAGNDSDDEGEESHATRGQISFSQGAEAQFNIISESESEEEEEEEEEEGEEEDSSDDQVPTGKKMIVKRQRPATNGRTKRKKIQVKRKSQAGRKKRRKM
ncbi:uncharacterized protein LOC124722620 [Schistocerca piceifrons]|uniref:uncharacterized protein LOC124722620 n=1 Tax=Schistocerca piceifrons TaxID=274613 RepID=UPI001F5F8E3D|nr:uncharacterized protein LOC124722620 [Schistocerca piceifrons]